MNARVLSTGYLTESANGGNILLDHVMYRDRDFLLIDESHNFRYPETQRYKLVEAFLASGRRQFFPKRDLETVEYSIEETYQGLYQKLRGYIGKANTAAAPANGKLPEELTYARYGLWHYVKKEKQKQEPYASLARAGRNLRGLMRILMFKRFESSVYAFQQTIGRMITMHERFLEALGERVVPAGEGAQAILYEPSAAEEQDLVDALRQVSGRYVLADFNAERLRQHIQHDLKLLRKILSLVEPITRKRTPSSKSSNRCSSKCRSGKASGSSSPSTPIPPIISTGT